MSGGGVVGRDLGGVGIAKEVCRAILEGSTTLAVKDCVGVW